MTDPTSRLTTAIADRYRIERVLGEGREVNRFEIPDLQLPICNRARYV